MIFPSLKNKNFSYINLNREAKIWIKEKRIKVSKRNNPLLNPNICQSFINEVHKKYSIDFSYGGWMEDRSFIWQGSYLEKDQMFIHLGIDINAPAGTEVATDFKSKVVKVDNDYPLDGGWGPYVILKNLEQNIYFIYSHLDKNILCKKGEILEKNTIFAKIGKAPFNGNWFSHLHIQSIDFKYYHNLEKNNLWEEFDGYGFKSDITLNVARHRDPMEFISLNK